MYLFKEEWSILEKKIKALPLSKARICKDFSFPAHAMYNWTSSAEY
jgi:hypothetical protein